jgi:hypothetical protein
MPSFINASGACDFISPHTINEIFVPGVTLFQMQITGDTSFWFPICVESTLSADGTIAVVAAVDKRLNEILKQKGLANVRFEVPIVDDIPVNKITRKSQLIATNRDSAS